MAIKSCALSLIDADHASLAACQVVCHLSWRIVLCDSTLHSSTRQVCDNPSKLITPAKSAASCARLLTWCAVANSRFDKTPTECLHESAYFKQSSLLALVKQHTPDQLWNYWKQIDEQQAAASKKLFGRTTHDVQEDETFWGLQSTAIGENFHMCPGKALCNLKRLLDVPWPTTWHSSAIQQADLFDCILTSCPTLKVECLVLHWTSLLLNLM